MTALRLPDSYFAKVYAHETDPWGFETREYERRKYEVTLNALPRSTYDHAFEPGCSIGVLSERLARRCARLTSMELVPHIAAVARDRLRDTPDARVLDGAIPERWPHGTFDLVVFSEVLYYLTADGLADTFSCLDASLARTGHIVAVHYRGATDYPLSGDQVHERLADHAAGRYRRVRSHQEPSFRLDVYQRRAA